MKVALIHYWLTGMRGGEAVLEALCDIFPGADIYTNVYDAGSVSKRLRQHAVKTTFIQRLPFARRAYQTYLPLMPMALESLDLSDYDLVISSESGPAKGVIVRPDALHVCYCHTPMRYLWDMHSEYRKSAGRLKGFLMAPMMHYLRAWDVTTASRVDHFIANSRFTAQRIERYYRRSAVIVHPPVDLSRFELTTEHEDYYLVLGQLVPYKRVDLAIDACNRLQRRLIVVGEGPMRKQLESRAGPTIEFMGRVSGADVTGYLASCRALLFPGCEDFGIVPIEAMACGRPVIAFGRGGALDSVTDGETGILFAEQSPDSMVDAIRELESRPEPFSPGRIRARAEHFDLPRFKEEVRRQVEKMIESRCNATQ